MRKGIITLMFEKEFEQKLFEGKRKKIQRLLEKIERVLNA